MKKRLFSLFMAFAALLSLFAGCGKNSSTSEETPDGTETEPVETEYVQTWESPDYSGFEMPAETDTLVVYSDGTASFLSNAIGIFKKTYPGVNVAVKSLGQDEYLSLIRTEIPAGKGPDLLVSTAKELPDVYKTMVTGIFEDLNPYFSNDGEIDLSDFNEGVLNGGILRERRYLVPIMYGLNTVLTTEEALAENGISPDELLTFDGFCDACAKFKTNNPDSHLFSSAITLRSYFNYLTEMYLYFGIEKDDIVEVVSIDGIPGIEKRLSEMEDKLEDAGIPGHVYKELNFMITYKVGDEKYGLWSQYGVGTDAKDYTMLTGTAPQNGNDCKYFFIHNNLFFN